MLAFDLVVIDVGSDPELERRYRVLVPVVEIDGEEAFVLEVDPDALRERLSS